MKRKVSKRMIQFWLFLFLSLAISQVVTVIYTHNRIQLERSQMEQVAMSRANKVNNVLTKLLYKTQILSAFVVRGNGDISDFEKVAATILDDPSVKNLILAPNGVVKYVYPLRGNESAVGLDFFSEGLGNKEALQAKELKELVLGGPFDLVQGGQALVGRLPIYLADQTFWGLASVTLEYPQALMGAELEQLKEQGFAFEIWRINPDSGDRQVIANSGYQYNRKASFVEYPMNILNAEWYFRLSPIRMWYQFPETWAFVGSGVLMSFLIGLLMLHNYDLNNMKKDFEQLSFVDPLTGILNRRGGFQELKILEDKNEPFLLCYMDLNNFKKINDKYGHNMGDQYIQNFAAVIQKNIDCRDYIFTRVGGDEFILVFKNTEDIEKMNRWFRQLAQELLCNKLKWNEQFISLSFSSGYACYPADGRNLDDLIAIADSRMYESKRIKKESENSHSQEDDNI